MTAEVAIVNRFGIALAADSAVTIGDERVWKTTNKLFSLGPHHDVGLMIYGGGTYLGCPWDTVIKEYRESIKDIQFQNIRDVVPSFSSFLLQARWGTDEEDILSIVRLIVKELDEYAGSFEDLDDDNERLKRLDKLITREMKAVKGSEKDFNYKKIDFEKIFGPYVFALCDQLFDFDVPEDRKKALLSYMYEYTIRKEKVSNHQTGIVFCGFGSEEIYPVLLEAYLDGRYKGILRLWAGREYDFNMDRGTLGTVVPFAQRDMTNIFMEGISGVYIRFFHTLMDGLLRRKSASLVDRFVADPQAKKTALEAERKDNRKAIKSAFEIFQELREEEFIQPLMSAIRSLPREEMSAMAEALVELTSLRRKMDSPLQSVAGPVDVAFVSKGDGFVWIKRKYYFDGKLNDDYLRRRHKRLG